MKYYTLYSHFNYINELNYNNEYIIIKPPSSKSLLIRGALISILSKEKLILRNVFLCDDIIDILSIMGSLNCYTYFENNNIYINSMFSNFQFFNRHYMNYISGSATVLRFVIALSILYKGKYFIKCSSQLSQRYNKYIEKVLNKLGIICFSNTINDIRNIYVSSNLDIKNINIHIDSSKTSQYLSAFVMIAPILKNTSIITYSNIVSNSYFNMTLKLISKLGINFKHQNDQIIVPGSQKYNVSKINKYCVESDWSSTCYLLAISAITGIKIKVNYINYDSIQPDSYFISILKKMGCIIKYHFNGVSIDNKATKSISIDMKNYPDLVPTISIIALFVKGITVIKNIAHLQYKESDRIQSIITEIRKLGAYINYTNNSIIIKPKPDYNYNYIIDTYSDHRIAMAFSLLVFKCNSIKISSIKDITKSFPDFYNNFSRYFNIQVV